MPRVRHPLHVRQRSDFAVGDKGTCANRVDALAGNFSISAFFNSDAAGRPIDVTMIHVFVDGNGVAIVGFAQGQFGSNPTPAAHAIVNYPPPPVQAFDFKNPTNPSTQQFRFGTQNGGMVYGDGGVICQIPAGFSLMVAPRNQNTAIECSIVFTFKRT